jgi:hypothetical protein
MTRQRYDDKGTEFGDWLRVQPALDSRHGYIATNLDYVWGNYKTGKWMLIEEKRFMGDVSLAQRTLLKKVHEACKADPNYLGMKLLQFEQRQPSDGRIYWNRKEISQEQLIEILKMENV